jgi:DNA processing protein
MARTVSVPTMTTHETTELLSLLQWPGIGPVKAIETLSRKRQGESLLDCAAERYPGVTLDQREAASERASRILRSCADLQIDVLGYSDELFPPLLRRIPDAPAIIYVRGESRVLHYPSMAVVGTRQVSVTGARAATLIARFLARRGFNVVSGLAFGVDMHAHLGALDAGGVTTAVLAHGLDKVSPAAHRELASRVMDTGGALVSEHPPGVPPRPAEFVRRNRLQSGLSLGSVVVESGMTGGSMHQARFTHTQHRRLFTVLAASEDTRGDLNEAGARHLIDVLGATPLRGTGDLAREISTVTISDRPVDQPPLDKEW